MKVKRSDRESVKLLRSLGQAYAQPDEEMSSDFANDHQGQRRDVSCLQRKAGYKTAVNPPNQKLQNFTCHTGGVHIRSTAGGEVRAAHFVLILVAAV